MAKRKSGSGCVVTVFGLIIIAAMVGKCSEPSKEQSGNSASVTSYSSSGPAVRFSTGQPSNHDFRPETVTLTQTVDIPVYENKKYVRMQPQPPGTVVNLRVIKGDKVIVEYQGGYKEIPATATDLIEQMVAAAGP